MFTDIIIGAGSAGCVLAAKLSAQPGRKVLIIEAGEHYRTADTPLEIRSPNCFPALADGRYLWPLDAVLSRDRNPEPYEQGRGVGGSSSINNTLAIRARRGDVGRWAELGCRSISWDDLVHHYKAVENDVDFGEEPEHGTQGPLTVSRWPASRWSRVDGAFRESVERAGFPWSPDLNSTSAVGAGPIPLTLAAGRRVSANDAFLDPAVEGGTVQVRANTTVRRVLLKAGRAHGVAVMSNGVEEEIYADNVIVSAGAVQSAALLLRSGIGSPELLRERGIPISLDLPAVGKSLIEHPLAVVSFGLRAEAQAAAVDLPPGNCLFRPEGSEQGDRWHLGCFGTSPVGREFGLAFAGLMLPRSRGAVSIDDAGEAVVDVNALGTDGDVRDLLDGCERLVNLLLSGPMQAVISGPLFLGVQPLDQEDLRANPARCLRSACFPYRHLASTCRMTDTADGGGVVGPDHLVWGADRLFVVDASVLPDATSSNTNLTVYAVASRAADLIARQK